MRFRGLGKERRGRGTERIPTGITSVHVSMSTHSLSEAFGKNAYLLPIRISWTLKSVTDNQGTHVTARKWMLGDHQERWWLPWCCPSQLAVQWNAVESCLKDDGLWCLEHVTSCQWLWSSKWPGSDCKVKRIQCSLVHLAFNAKKATEKLYKNY